MHLYYAIYFVLILAHFIEAEETVIIIGAGAAGISAALQIVKHNIPKVIILEAEDRIGGRIHSVKFGDSYVDMGAEWCQGHNIVYEHTKDYNILKPSNFTGGVWYPRGVTLPDDVREDLLKFVEFIINTVDDAQPGYSSAGDFFTKKYSEKVLEKYKNDSVKLKIAVEAVPWVESHVLGLESAFSWYNISMKSNFTPVEGHQYLNWNGYGYKTILDILMGKYPDPTKPGPLDDKILLGKEVTTIDWSSSPIKVTCLDGTVYIGDYVIFTPSLGVLKEQHSSLFTPALPNNTVTAINNMAIGAVIKVQLQFENSWWEPVSGNDTFSFMWNIEENQKLREKYPEGPTHNGNVWLTSLGYVMPAVNNSKVLTGWISGPMVPEIEKLSNETLINGCMYALDVFLGKKYNITQPINMLRSSWYSNPHFRGTWSYVSTAEEAAVDKFGSLKILMSSVDDKFGKPKIVFAGEALHPKYASTVHGAIGSADYAVNKIHKARDGK